MSALTIIAAIVGAAVSSMGAVPGHEGPAWNTLKASSTQAEPARIAATVQTLPRPVVVDGSPSWRSSIEKRIQECEYHATWRHGPSEGASDRDGAAGAWQAPNRAQRFRTVFSSDGIRIVPREVEKRAGPAWQWGLTLVGYGRLGAMLPVDAAEIGANEGRVDLSRGNLTEWYINDERGLKQGFTIQEDPSAISRQLSAKQGGKSDDSGRAVLRVEQAITGNLCARLNASDQSIDFLTDGGVCVLRYSELKVTDATGRELRAWFELAGKTLTIVVDDRDAVYPIIIDPLTTSPTWTAESDQASAWYGTSVATAGDVNGDGFSDVIVGAPQYDNGEADEGRVYVYHGSASGVAASPSWTAESDQASAFFGLSAATLGDVNGDGYSDVIVGAYYYDNGQTDEGVAFVWHGSALGLNGGVNGTPANAAWIAQADQATARFGISVASAGDVNGDGYSDAIIGATYYDNGNANEGVAFVWHGSAAGLNGGESGSPANDAWRVEGNLNGFTNGGLGASVASAGDVNGDGYGDVVVGHPGYGTDSEGRAAVYHGSSSGLAASPAWSFESNQFTGLLGLAVATAGDVNGDGYSDVIAGTYSYDNPASNEGGAFLFHGGPSGLSASPNWATYGVTSGYYHGASVATAGDINADGYADVIVATPRFFNGQSNEGRVVLYMGSAGGLSASASWTYESNQVSGNIGANLLASSSLTGGVATAGDVNGDGYSDVIVGAAAYDNGQTDEGRAYIFHGSAAGLATTPGWAAESDSATANSGYSVASAGDVNGDGYADLLIGAPFYDNGETDEGAAFLWNGAATGLGSDGTPGNADWSAEGNQMGAQFGYAVASAGDINGDGYDDVLVGANLYDNGETDEGGMFVYHGSSGGLVVAAPWQLNEASAQFAASLAGAGDVNGDGYADVVIGAPQRGGGAGASFMLHGSPSGLVDPDWEVNGGAAGDNYGSSVASAGDVNRDGYSDVIVGAPGFSSGAGAAYAYHGSAAGLSGSAAWSISGVAGSSFGRSVAPAGDINGDGYSDAVVGAPTFTQAQPQEGAVYAFHGSGSGFGAPAFSTRSNFASAQLGFSVAGAGDVNGDGYSDAAFGGPGHLSGQGMVLGFHGSAAGLVFGNFGVTSGVAGSSYGRAVSSAGDVNGDGYSEIVVGAPTYGGSHAQEGRNIVYFGNGGPGASIRPQQRRADDAAPIARLGRSDAADGFRLALLGRTPYGRGQVKLEWEVKPRGTSFDGTGLQQSASYMDTGTAGAALNELLTGLAGDMHHHWRVRLRYHAAAMPFQQFSRWITMPHNGWNESDVLLSLPPSANLLLTIGNSARDAEDCIQPGSGTNETLIVRVELRDSNRPVTGGQFFLAYDTATVEFLSAVPGDEPFTREIFEFVDDMNGAISYAVGIEDEGTETSSDSIMAVLTFRAVGENCTSTSLVRFSDPGDDLPPTRLSDNNDDEVPVTLADLPGITSDFTLPDLLVPGDISVHSDAGECQATFTTLAAVQAYASDNCDTNVSLNFVRSDTKLNLLDSFESADSPITITWTAEDNCGNQSTAMQTITVSDQNELLVDVELSPTLDPVGSLERCITFDAWACGESSLSPTATSSTEVFVPTSTPHRVLGASVLLPCGHAYECLTARDQLHTLRSTAPDFADDGTTYSATFIGNRLTGGHWLTQGNLNDDRFIDILDFGSFVVRFQSTYDSDGDTNIDGNADCNTPLFHADISGDGRVFTEDFTFIQINFLKRHEDNCCGASGLDDWTSDDPTPPLAASRLDTSPLAASRVDAPPLAASREFRRTADPVRAISVADLWRLGLGELAAADLNGDGTLDEADMADFAEGLGLPAMLDQVLAVPTEERGRPNSPAKRH